MVEVREFLRKLPITHEPSTGIDFRREPWFAADRGYPCYVEAARVIQPTSILEIGSHVGFGLASFIHGHPSVERVAVVDNESYIPGSLALCERNLAFFGGSKTFTTMLDGARGSYDLIHVDGDHSVVGAVHDMAYSWGLQPRVMLVDDYAFLSDVRQGVHAFARHHGLDFKVWSSYRGWAVFAGPDVLAALPDDL